MSKKRIKAICVYCGSRMGVSNEYSYNAKLLGQKIANNNMIRSHITPSNSIARILHVPDG